MKRRRFVTALAASPAAPALLAQQPAAPPQPARSPSTNVELPKLEFTIADDVADPKLAFFTTSQFAALRKLADILMPALDENPGALDAKAPEFLDFLLAQSPTDRQSLYRAGLDALNGAASKRFQKSFAGVDANQSATLLEPLRQPWTYDAPADPLAKFLRAAKQDLRTATVNSREYAAAADAAGRRGMSGLGAYWLPLD